METKKISKVTPFVMAMPSIILGIYIHGKYNNTVNSR